VSESKVSSVEHYLHALGSACVEAAREPRPLLFMLLLVAPRTIAELWQLNGWRGSWPREDAAGDRKSKRYDATLISELQRLDLLYRRRAFRSASRQTSNRRNAKLTIIIAITICPPSAAPAVTQGSPWLRGAGGRLR
jgi:hypothetical protein